MKSKPASLQFLNRLRRIPRRIAELNKSIKSVNLDNDIEDESQTEYDIRCRVNAKKHTYQIDRLKDRQRELNKMGFSV